MLLIMDRICRILSTCNKDILFVDGDNSPDCLVNFEECLTSGVVNFPFQIFFFTSSEANFRVANKLSEYPWFTLVKAITNCSQSADCNMMMTATSAIFLARNSNLYLLSRDKVFSEAAIRLREMNMDAREISVLLPVSFIDFIKSYIPGYISNFERKKKKKIDESQEKCGYCSSVEHESEVCAALGKYQQFLCYLKNNYHPRAVVAASQLGQNFIRTLMYEHKDDFRTLRNQAIADGYLIVNPDNTYQLIIQESLFLS